MSNTREAKELEAAKWLQRRDSENWTAEDDARLEEWLNADTNHRVAYLRLEAAWREMNRLQALGAGHPRGSVPTPEELETWRALPTQITSARRRNRWLAFAASVLLVLGIGAYIGVDYFAGTKYSTQTGAISTVPLKDGSNVTLSTASSILVRLKDHERHIDLTRGEAYFEVAHDPGRPFIVQAGDKRITAVGTKFSVRREVDDVRVIVTEGKVKIEAGEGASTPTAPAHAEQKSATFLSAGEVASTRNTDIQVRTLELPQVEEQLSWRQGYVIFHETALADAVAEFNRYNERKIVIEDPRIAAMQLSGKFRSTNIDTFVSLLEQTYGIHTQADADKIVLK